MRRVETEAAEARADRRVGEFLAALGTGVGLGGLEGGRLVGFRVRLPTEADPSTLLIVRAVGAAGKVIAFVGAYKVGDAVLAWRARAAAGKMQWREDLPWDGVKGGDGPKA